MNGLSITGIGARCFSVLNSNKAINVLSSTPLACCNVASRSLLPQYDPGYLVNIYVPSTEKEMIFRQECCTKLRDTALSLLKIEANGKQNRVKLWDGG